MAGEVAQIHMPHGGEVGRASFGPVARPLLATRSDEKAARLSGGVLRAEEGSDEELVIGMRSDP